VLGLDSEDGTGMKRRKDATTSRHMEIGPDLDRRSIRSPRHGTLLVGPVW
jgi:hypothetical protein